MTHIVLAGSSEHLHKLPGGWHGVGWRSGKGLELGSGCVRSGLPGPSAVRASVRTTLKTGGGAIGRHFGKQPRVCSLFIIIYVEWELSVQPPLLLPLSCHVLTISQAFPGQSLGPSFPCSRSGAWFAPPGELAHWQRVCHFRSCV